MKTLYCGSGEELYPVYTCTEAIDGDCDTPLEFTDEEAAMILRAQEESDKAQKIVAAKLDAYYAARRQEEKAAAREPREYPPRLLVG
jgi:hypothetical protein